MNKAIAGFIIAICGLTAGAAHAEQSVATSHTENVQRGIDAVLKSLNSPFANFRAMRTVKGTRMLCGEIKIPNSQHKGTHQGFLKFVTNGDTDTTFVEGVHAAFKKRYAKACSSEAEVANKGGANRESSSLL